MRRKKHNKLEWNGDRKDLDCQLCGRLVENLPADTKAVTCSVCCIRQSAPPDLPVKKEKPESPKPKGWHFKKRFVDVDGKVYELGKPTGEVVDPPSKLQRELFEDFQRLAFGKVIDDWDTATLGDEL